MRSLQSLNQLCAEYIEGAGFGQEFMTRARTLKRVPIPPWTVGAPCDFPSRQGECRECKRSLTMVISRLETECYFHIVPLARFGANDVTNLQLLCEPGNLKKAAGQIPLETSIALLSPTTRILSWAYARREICQWARKPVTFSPFHLLSVVEAATAVAYRRRQIHD